ncbi:hypothetical protein E8E14_002708 [Neopestalotiopsis sp. 37M]|nr:hypothetical protein E8E14_002708 [Neopestalotiopsis sp. 37M]
MDIDLEECLDPDDNSIYTFQEDAWNNAHTENQTTAIESSEHFMVDEDTTKDTNSSAEYLHTVVQLALASLHKIFGVKKRFLGIRTGDPISPSLLELAPCVCNTSYIQVSRNSVISLLLFEHRLELFAEIFAQTVATYASHFSAIADIIADASAWRPSLLDKIVKLPTEPPDDHEEPLQYHRNDTRYAVRQNLWTLLHTSLDCNTGMRQALSRVDRSSRQLELQHSESLLFSEDTADQCNDYEMEDAIDLPEIQVWHQSNYYISPETFEWASASPYGEPGLRMNSTTELNREDQWELGDSPAHFENSHLLLRDTQNDDDVMIDGTTPQPALHLSTDLDYDDACRTEFTHYEQQRCHNADNLTHQSLVEYGDGDGDEDWDDAKFEHYETSQESDAACEMAAYPPDPLI